MNEQVGEEEDSPFFLPLLRAARPKSLLAAIVPVSLGFVLAQQVRGMFSSYLFVFTLLSTLCLQVATNFFNDAIDYEKGADGAERIGPERMAGSGALAPASLIIAAVTMLAIAVTMSFPLLVARGWPIIAIGIPSLYFTFGYTGGRWSLAYLGLGEIFVFVFFGLVAVAGSCFVASGEWLPESLLLGAQVGLLATVLIAVNNARDSDGDRAVGKRRLAARFGLRFARMEIALCCIAPYLIGVLWFTAFERPLACALPLLGLILSCSVAWGVSKTEPSPEYNRFLGLSALALLNFAILFSLGLYFG